MTKALKPGPYDLLITSDMLPALQQHSTVKQIPVTDLADGAMTYLVDVLSRRLLECLTVMEGTANAKLTAQINLVNDLLSILQQTASARESNPTTIPVFNPAVLQWLGVGDTVEYKTPQTGLLSPWLFTAGRGSPDLLNELRAEMSSCDRLDMLVSFIKVSGVRKIRDILEAMTSRDANGQQRARIRIITTTYTGATDAQAIDELARLPGCEVKVSLDAQRSRLHAKAWVFHRSTGFGTAYVGSANLSHSAMMGGLEWTVKFAERGNAALFARAAANFETLWEDGEFQLYNPNDDIHKQALIRALRDQGRGFDSTAVANIGFLEVTPKPFQQEILDQLAFERSHGRLRNLLVAATGTGKTVMAALDYRRYAQECGGRPRLLFVAHQVQILQQARHTFRQVLNDSQFGELLADGATPERFDHLFAVINSVHSRALIDRLGSEFWAMVIVDECHHIAANQFSKFVQAVKPRILLGLTATPERGDGQSIMGFFDARPDGSPAAELRLWQALDLQLLCPFEYYGCDDDTDFSSVNWGQAGETTEVARLVEGNQLRALNMLREWQRLTSNPRDCRTLIFCATIAHADFIAKFLNSHKLPAMSVHTDVPIAERNKAPKLLLTGELCALVTVGLYNEGIDLPFVDTLILLRPTQSPVVFQQQLGRGLRLHSGKTTCLVMDFVGQHRKDFRFDRLLGAISGLTRAQLKAGFEEGFPTLPSGCYLHLQKQTRQQVLGQLQAMISQRWSMLIRELTVYASLIRQKGGRPKLADFLEEYNLLPEDIFRKVSSGQTSSGWLNLLDSAGELQVSATEKEKSFSQRLHRIMHWDDPVRIDCLSKWTNVSDDSTAVTEFDRCLNKMLYFQMWGRSPDESAPQTCLVQHLDSSNTREELQQFYGLVATKCHLVDRRVPGLEDTPLCLHASYSANEIAVAMGWFTPTRQAPITSGVLVLVERKCEALFVTLDKSTGFHDSIAYTDCAISPQRFKWQTMNSAGPHTPVGKRYLNSMNNGWSFQLFVRVRKGDPFHALGPVRLRSADGSGPMTIHWDLVIPMSARLFREFSVVRDV